MARRLTHAVAIVVLASCVGGASACANASEIPEDSTLASMAGAASVTTAIVRSYNDAVVDDYVLQTLTNGSGPVSVAQPCVTADNRLSRRASPLANPPYAEASIVQRDRVMRVLGAYAFLAATVSRDAVNADADLAAAEFERATVALNAAANVHAQGDLFVEDRAAVLAAVAARPREARDGAAMRDIVERANPSVQQLIALLGADAGKRRIEAIAATQLVLRDLIAYATSRSATRELQASPASHSSPVGTPVSCSQPLVASFGAASPSSEIDMSAAIAALSPALRSRAQKTRERAAALSAVNFDRLFEALSQQARAASVLPLQQSRIQDAANDVTRESAAVGRDGLKLTAY